MVTSNKKFRAAQIAAIVAMALLLTAVAFLMNHVQDMLNSDAKVSLSEIATQNKDVIASKLKVQVSDLDIDAAHISDRLQGQTDRSPAALNEAFRQFCSDVGQEASSDLFISDVSVNALFPDGRTVDISGRSYFRFALAGEQNISNRTVSRLTGEDLFVISVPLKVQDAIIGTLQREYSPDEMYNICSLSLFSSQGFMNIVDSEGYVLISSQPGYNRESDNHFRSLYANGHTAASDQLRNDVAANRAGFMETTIDGISYFSAYTPIEDIHDWYLITSVASDAVTANSSNVIMLFYAILLIVVATFFIGMMVFLSYKQRQQRQLESIAFVDPVTGGATFNRFELDLSDELKKHPEEQHSLLVFDIDNFKYINSYYGFEHGDRVLRSMHQAAQSELAPGELLARISTDHFIMLLDDASDERLDGLLNRIRNSIDIPLYLTAGLYPIQDRTQSPNLMADKASAVAQASKGQLGARVACYTSDFDEQQEHNEQMKRDIEQALAHDELEAFYQPKVDISSRKLVGAEALVRWRKPDGTLVPPFEFIPLCEKTGLVVDLDFSVLGSVLNFLHRQLDEGVECVPVSVNFSRLHLADSDFVNRVSGMLSDAGVPPELVELELTESILFGSKDDVAAFANEAHRAGLRLAMDDFGSGYSSLNMLKDIPIDTIKIDQGFLSDTGNSARQETIFAAVIKMAEGLDIDIVVEGVETADNVSLMSKHGCLVAQGYFFARPMDEATFEPIYRKGRTA
ncbi:bifunctional diguanylate cyclase/phosphodiesterase [Gordonibacter sp.]|uniref:bifunctional diguanylate cyclase/phosphodiesterase n=2 Tax=Gordonibacter sp. TaxID=1968902 RepID=UPI002FCC4A25